MTGPEQDTCAPHVAEDPEPRDSLFERWLARSPSSNLGLATTGAHRQARAALDASAGAHRRPPRRLLVQVSYAPSDE